VGAEKDLVVAAMKRDHLRLVQAAREKADAAVDRAQPALALGADVG